MPSYLILKIVYYDKVTDKLKLNRFNRYIRFRLETTVPVRHKLEALQYLELLLFA